MSLPTVPLPHRRRSSRAAPSPSPNARERIAPSRAHTGPAAALGAVCLGVLALLAIGCGGDIETRMSEVRALQDVGQFTESIEELREILAISPNLPEANYRLGVALMQTGEPSRAIWALQKASEAPDYAIVAGLMLASAHFGIQSHEEAIRAADAVLEIDPERMVALLIRAQSHLGAAQLEQAWEDTSRLVELYPDDYRVRALESTVLADLGRLDEAEAAAENLKQMGAASGDPEIENRSCLAPAYFAEEKRKDTEKAEALYEDCLEKFPTDSFVVGQAMAFFDRIGKRERSMELIRRSVEAAPEALGLRSNLANRLANAGDVEGAEEILVEAVDSFGSAAAWNLLAGFYRRQQNTAKALEAVEKVIELSGGGSDALRFTQADILVDLGELDRADEVANALNEPTYARLIRGRILLERGDAKGALEAFDAGIRHWPNNAGARYLAGLAARELGDYERAMSELREAIRADQAATDAALVLASIHFARGEYGLAASFVNTYLRNPGVTQREYALLLGARTLTQMGEYERARRSLKALSEVTSSQQKVALQNAEIDRAESGPAAAAASIENSGFDLLDPENADLLRAWADYLVQANRGETALVKAEAGAKRHPDSSLHHEIRANLLARLGRTEEARVAFEKSLELDPGNASATGGLATLAANRGDLAAGIEGFDRAAELAGDDLVYAYSAAQLTLMSGDKAGAEARLREIVRRDPGQAGARNDLAWLLAERGQDLDLALSLAEAARRIDPSPEILDTLGYVHLKRGESTAAVAAFEKALEADADAPSIRYRLATALDQAGDSQRAREMLQLALAAGTFPEAEAAKRDLARLEDP
ncbi:MAG: tetratricopeptide repeat protein [Myxococcales bacterium]|nr:tetratricopeptide repeat protein [Myxococcales bacterium]